MGASKTKENKGHNTILNMNHSNATFKPFILGVYIIPGVYIVPGVYIIPAGKLLANYNSFVATKQLDTIIHSMLNIAQLKCFKFIIMAPHPSLNNIRLRSTIFPRIMNHAFLIQVYAIG